MNRDSDTQQAATAAANGVVFEVADRALDGIRAANEVRATALEAARAAQDGVRAAQSGGARIAEVAHQWRNASPERVAGRVAEEWHAATFNVDAAAKGLGDLRATTGASAGTPTAAADIAIRRGNELVDLAQSKYHGNPAGTAFHVADVKYDGMQRVVPSDQVARVRELASKRGVDGLGQRNFPDVAKSASDRLAAHGAESTPLTRPDAVEMAVSPERGAAKLDMVARGHEVKAQQRLQAANSLVNSRVGSAMKAGAVAGAAVGGGISAVSNIVAYSRGTKSGGEAAVDVAKDTATCAVAGAAVSGAAVAAEAALIRAGAGALAVGAAPVAIGITAVEMAKDVGRFAKGDIDGKKLARNSGANLVKGGTTWGGMEGGAAIGTLILPGVGTVVGGIVGGIGGALFGSWITS